MYEKNELIKILKNNDWDFKDSGDVYPGSSAIASKEVINLTESEVKGKLGGYEFRSLDGQTIIKLENGLRGIGINAIAILCKNNEAIVLYK